MIYYQKLKRKLGLNKAVVTHMTHRVWLINPASAQGPKGTVKFLGGTWAGAARAIPQATKVNGRPCQPWEPSGRHSTWSGCSGLGDIYPTSGDTASSKP